MSCPPQCLLTGFDACRAAVRDTIAIAVKGELFSPSKEPANRAELQTRQIPL